jgi:hypothetical protein
MAEITYKIGKPLKENRRKHSLKNLLAFIILILILLLLIYILYSKLLHPNKRIKKVVSQTTHTTIAGPTVYLSKYFKFSDTNVWKFTPNNDTQDGYSYALQQDGETAAIVTVYVNYIPTEDTLASSRVIPVTVNSDASTLSLGSISGECNSVYTPADLKNIVTVSLAGTSMVCRPDSEVFSVEVGQTGGNYVLHLKESNGQMATYVILFEDTSFTTDPTPFLDFLHTFQAT